MSRYLMEKVGLSSGATAASTHPHNVPRHLSKTHKAFYLSAALVLSFLALANFKYTSDPLICHEKEFRWEDIAPTEDIILHPCFGKYQCARLSVPLDYSTPSSTPNRTAAIAITVLGATTEPWGGPVLINPGGPGGSGVSFVLSHGELIQRIIGPQFSIVGFDPRGVNNTTPAFSCFEDLVQRKVFNAKDSGRVLEGGSEVGEAYARSRALSETCGAAAGNVGGYVNSASVARDMLEITDRMWASRGESGRGLRYWGFSYGSVLGSTFAAMFPDRVERLVVDGVCDAQDYYATGWKANLQDTNKVFASFPSYCSLAGPLRCAFHTGTTPADVSIRLAKLLLRLKVQPTAVSDSTTGTPEIITYSDVKTLIFKSLYNPLVMFPVIADILAALDGGDGKPFLAFERSRFECSCPGPRDPNVGDESATAIICSDGEFVSDNITEFGDYLKELNSQAEFGGVWAKIRLSCVRWKFRPKGLNYNGPFTGDTSNPLLFIGNTADPVTPVRNAHTMSKGFPGSVVLEQNSEGHCSISAPSLCTAKFIRNYFETGKLPPPGTICAADLKPFLGGSSVKAISADDRDMFEALEELAKSWDFEKFGPQTVTRR